MPWGTPFPPFSIDDTELHTWFERDRAHVELRNRNTDRTIIEFWDDEVYEAAEDGFITLPPFPRLLDEEQLHVEVYNLAHERGMLSEKAVRA